MIKKGLGLFLFAFLIMSANAQVVIQPLLQSKGTFQKSQLWNLLVINNGNQINNCRLEIILREQQSGLEILQASSGYFQIKSGVQQMNSEMLEPVQYNDSHIKGDLLGLGMLNNGNYYVGYTLWSLDIKETKIAEEFIGLDVEPLELPSLVFPLDSAVLDNVPSVLTWTSPVPKGIFNTLQYDVRIFEIAKNSESIDETPIFYKTGNATEFLEKNEYAEFLKKGKEYQWDVRVYDNLNFNFQIKPWRFFIKMETKIEEAIRYTPYVKLKINYAEKTIAPEGYLKFSYYSNNADTIAQVRIRNVSNSNKVVLDNLSVNIVPGENLFQIPLGEKVLLDEKSIYKVELVNTSKETWFLMFMYKKIKE